MLVTVGSKTKQLGGLLGAGVALARVTSPGVAFAGVALAGVASLVVVATVVPARELLVAARRQAKIFEQLLFCR